MGIALPMIRPASEIGSDSVDVSNSVQVNQAPASEPMVVSCPVDAPINIDNFSSSQTHTATPNDIQQSHFIPMSAPVNDYNNPTQSNLLDCSSLSPSSRWPCGTSLDLPPANFVSQALYEEPLNGAGCWLVTQPSNPNRINLT